jgi:DNA-binding NtrC family response regulator
MPAETYNHRVSNFDFDDKSTLHVRAPVGEATGKEHFTLTVERGPSQGASFMVTATEPQAVVIGQSPVCPVRLKGETVSRRHAAVQAELLGLRVTDLGSKNGTRVNGVRILDAIARAGDLIELGETALRVQAGPGTSDKLPITDRFGEAVGVSVAMRRLFPLLERLSATSIPVLIEGETGTGKEAVAQSIHMCGPRSKSPFVVFDCTAVASNLIESELFGHEKGAFTGAVARRKGVFEQAQGGTLFVDELGDLPIDLQAKLLRALETGQVRRVGGDTWIRCDARVIAATRRDIERRISDGLFRDDLFHRLAVGRVALPPLRDRRTDIPLLVEHFCGLLGAPASKIPHAVMETWLQETWPGNVRELRNAVTRQITLGDLGSLASPPGEESEPDAPAGRSFQRILDSKAPYEEARQAVLALFQRHYTESMVAAHGGHVQHAAEASGLALRYFQLLRARARE